MATLSFDASSVEPQQAMTPIPAGTYLAQAIDSEERPLKSGSGRCAAFTFQILEGQYAGRRVWAQINYQHTSADAERIGQSQLSALCHAVGVLNLRDTVDVHGKPVLIRVKIRKDESGQYGDKNEVSGYEAPAQGGAPRAAAAPSGFPPAPAAAPTRPAADAQRPWARRA